jgi:hypothetical protein
VEDVGGRRDGVRPEEEVEARLAAGSQQAVGQGEVTGDVAVPTLGQDGRGDLEGVLEQLGRLAEVEPGLEGGQIGVADDLLVGASFVIEVIGTS